MVESKFRSSGQAAAKASQTTVEPPASTDIESAAEDQKGQLQPKKKWVSTPLEGAARKAVLIRRLSALGVFFVSHSGRVQKTLTFEVDEKSTEEMHKIMAETKWKAAEPSELARPAEQKAAMRSLKLSGVDPEFSNEEVKELLQRRFDKKECIIASVRRVLRPKRSQDDPDVPTVHVFVRLSKEFADALIIAKKVKLACEIVQVSRPDRPRCFKCQEHNHIARHCKKPQCCRKCARPDCVGVNPQTRFDCPNVAHCPSCKRMGLDAAHIAGTRDCQAKIVSKPAQPPQRSESKQVRILQKPHLQAKQGASYANAMRSKASTDEQGSTLMQDFMKKMDERMSRLEGLVERCVAQLRGNEPESKTEDLPITQESNISDLTDSESSVVQVDDDLAVSAPSSLPSRSAVPSAVQASSLSVLLSKGNVPSEFDTLLRDFSSLKALYEEQTKQMRTMKGQLTTMTNKNSQLEKDMQIIIQNSKRKRRGSKSSQGTQDKDNEQ